MYVIDGSGAKRNSGLRAIAADWRSHSSKAVIWAWESCKVLEKYSGIVDNLKAVGCVGKRMRGGNVLWGEVDELSF